MIIAVSYKDNEIFEHFGHAEMFAVYKTNDDNTEIISKEIVEVKESGHQAVADLMDSLNVDAVIVGNIGVHARAALDGGAPLFVLDGAVIVGTAAQAECDRLCVVTAPFETSVARIVARDGISAEMAARRLNAQTPEAVLTAQADYVLRNDADLAHLQAAAEELCGKLLAEGGAGKEL